MDTLKEYETLVKELKSAESDLIEAGRSNKERSAEETKRIITNAEKELQVLGINALGPIHQNIEKTSKIFANDGVVTYFTLDPFKSMFAEREKFEKTPYGRLHTEWYPTITGLEDAYIRADRKGELTVNLHNLWPLLSLVSSDTGTNNGNMQLNIYPDIEGERGLTGKTFQLSATGDVNGEQNVYGACVDFLGALVDYSNKITPDMFGKILTNAHKLWLNKYGEE